MSQSESKLNADMKLSSPQDKANGTADVDREDLARFQTTPEGDSRVVMASVFFLVVVIFVGVPVWLKTTATYQAPLPFWDIKALCSRPIRVTIPVKLISFADVLTELDLDSIKSDLTTSDDSSLRCGTPATSMYAKKLNISCSIHTRSISLDDRAVVKKILTQSSSIDDLLIRLNSLFQSYLVNETTPRNCTGSDCHSTASPKYTFAILPDTVHPLLLAQNSESNSAVPSDPSLPGAIMHSESGTENVIFIVLPTTEPSSHRRKLTLYLAKLLNTVLLHVDELQHLVQSRATPWGAESLVDRDTEIGIAQTLTKQLLPSNAYDITVTMVTNADEARENSTISSSITWHEHMLRDPTNWLKEHVQSAFDSWLPHVRVQFFSQRLHAVDIEQLVPSRISTDRRYRYYTADDLSILVNHLESYLGAPQAASAAARDLAGTKPGLHLILSLAMPVFTDNTSTPICPQPLRFHLTSTWSPFTVTNVAMVPQWGGLFTVDAPSPCRSEQSSTSHSQSVMLARQLVAVIQTLLGLHSSQRPQLPNLIELGSIPPKSIPPAQSIRCFQLNDWFLRRTVESLLSIKLTMTSLVDLLSRFPNMVINDHVAYEVTRSTRVWTRSMEKLANLHVNVDGTATDLGTVFDDAQDALESVNSAFFDHSLLGRLYFQVMC
ncbi:Phosphatidylinositol glycan class S [Fasciolopsis buskii]|uniref:Phosphatidylinositol glycan class S n=1 Tax=Fasciolopsis buskii TaxID=27845 RepID=A0A8E0S203_9TREM|nr:Phosphatidylinositol glycan class S [Fasciolopsis buski]